MNKFYFFVFVLTLVSFASAQSGVAGQIGEATDNLEKNVTAIREFTESQRGDFLGAQWKEILLKSETIAGIDKFFTKINWLFFFLFSMNWNLSIQMLFVFLVWLFVLLSLVGYVECFLIKLKREKFLIALGLTIVLAHAKLFYYISVGITKLVFFKTSAWWRSTSLILIVVGLWLFSKINNEISKTIMKNKEKQKVDDLERRAEKLEKFRSGVKSSSG